MVEMKIIYSLEEHEQKFPNIFQVGKESYNDIDRVIKNLNYHWILNVKTPH